MKRFIFLINLVVLTFMPKAQEVKFEWVKSMGGIGHENTQAIAVDVFGNVYTTGSFSGTADFDPDSNKVFNMTAFGEPDVFISKLDSLGNFVWARQFGGQYFDMANALALDSLGNIYITGSFDYSAIFIQHSPAGSDTINIQSKGGENMVRDEDIFILKMDSQGNLLWIKQIGGVDSEITYALALSGGYIYLTGEFDSPKVDFDPGVDSFNLTISSLGNHDIFICKLDLKGNFEWVKSVSSIYLCSVYGITVDGFGNVYTGGTFGETMDFDPDPLKKYTLKSKGNSDGFILKLDNNGNFVWAKQIGNVKNTAVVSLNLDKTGNLYLSGDFQEKIDIDPSKDTFNLVSRGKFGSFILKLDNNGNFIVAKSDGYWADIDIENNILCIGNLTKTLQNKDELVNFDLIPIGGEVNCIIKLDSLLNLVWAINYGTTPTGGIDKIRLDKKGNLYATGTFSGTATFIKDIENTVRLKTRYEIGFNDIFVYKLSQPNFNKKSKPDK